MFARWAVSSKKSTLSAVDSLARTSRSLAEDLASRVLAAASGTSTLASFAYYDPATSSLRTCQRSLLGASDECSVTLPRAGTMRSGFLSVLSESAHLIGGNGSSLLPTPTVHGNYNKAGLSATSGDGLATVVGGPLNPEFVRWLMGFPDGWLS